MRVVAVVLLMVLGGCSTALPTVSPLATAHPVSGASPTWIGVFGPADWVAPQDMTLEVGDQAWLVIEGGGVASFELTENTSVRLIGADDCHEYAAFEARPGRMYLIRFEMFGLVSVEEPSAMDSGPGLPERDPATDCR